MREGEEKESRARVKGEKMEKRSWDCAGGKE